MSYENPLFVAGIAVASLALGYLIRQSLGTRFLRQEADKKAREALEAADLEAKNLVLKAKDRAVFIVEEAKREEKEIKSNLDRMENRLLRKEETLEKETADLKEQAENLKKNEEEIAAEKSEVDHLKENIKKELVKLSGLTPQEAKEKLIKEVEDQHRIELKDLLQKFEKEKRDEVEKRSLEVITTSIQRYARSHVSDITTTSYTLPNEDLKGKIIGREGRNIRTLERLTGVELIIDEAPDTIIISSFDPMRREICRMALEKLIKDGRIQPAKIEEKVEEARLELDKRMYEIGEAAAYEAGVVDLPKEIIQLLGRLNFRTSFGQNVLSHSIEVAAIAGMIAEELGINADVTRKAALLHDIGKAIDHEVAGNHVELGIKILKKYSVDDRVVTAMQSHHEDYPFSSPESFIVATADIVSAARPGARRGTLENYLKRLEDLEKIASTFEGVKNSYAISAGRELRVFVVPEKIDDFGALQLAKNIAAKIEAELKYPGDIKVNIIREVRAVEYAR
ncbi:MAG TPA: ribonuclease Y [Candidatus Colwellbacteria bacterium]|nr:ribonuclease Y [Candidatus Colwellbacteria bacterium]